MTRTSSTRVTKKPELLKNEQQAALPATKKAAPKKAAKTTAKKGSPKTSPKKATFKRAASKMTATSTKKTATKKAVLVSKKAAAPRKSRPKKNKQIKNTSPVIPQQPVLDAQEAPKPNTQEVVMQQSVPGPVIATNMPSTIQAACLQPA
mmetsp:Transcript_18973/g.31468  ORF Transcript_18973/g.31468 Transcript_18973/m.31468 type:complete len:149 (+) Transcript_18973:133-579(+)|eukprot:CAMPEP_0119011744 /NCGR_PEP_ID=MMETSP1176-20130426/5863_1 /TAXON_ID=265551 /ORGANISM="Synedropsis recta cf, Strain CCMP1620" /LENGTH=148 /DNA_ID=CAMNT_0006964603 /DNA_START=80 /DNA_END=526 /DNA_ORIENTATION=-